MSWLWGFLVRAFVWYVESMRGVPAYVWTWGRMAPALQAMGFETVVCVAGVSRVWGDPELVQVLVHYSPSTCTGALELNVGWRRLLSSEEPGWWQRVVFRGLWGADWEDWLAKQVLIMQAEGFGVCDEW